MPGVELERAVKSIAAYGNGLCKLELAAGKVVVLRDRLSGAVTEVEVEFHPRRRRPKGWRKGRPEGLPRHVRAFINGARNAGGEVFHRPEGGKEWALALPEGQWLIFNPL